MSISVKFFASLQELIGTGECTIDHEAGMTATDVWRQSTDGLDLPANTLCAVNLQYCKLDAEIADNDEVAFFPPVTGG